VTAPKAQCTPFEKVRVLQRKLYRAAKAQPQRTFGVLYDKVCRLEVLEMAWVSLPITSFRFKSLILSGYAANVST
jgi:hypothetical protein